MLNLISGAGIGAGKPPPQQQFPGGPPGKGGDSGADLEAAKSAISTQQQAATQEAQSAAPAQTATSAEKATKTEAQIQPQTWQVSTKEVMALLVKNGLPTTPDCKTLCLLMMQFGVELSMENFEKAFKLLKGRKDKSSIESTAVSLSKGLEDCPESVEYLRQFLAQKQQVGEQIQRFLQALEGFKQDMTSGQSFTDKIQAGLSSILSDLDDELKKLIKKKKKGDKLDLSEFKRGDITTDLYNLKQLLSGLEEKFDNIDAATQNKMEET